MTAQDQLDGRVKHRLTVDEFLLLDREGAFGGRSVELIDGEIFYMSPKHRPHARTVTALTIAIAKALEAANSPLSVIFDVTVRLSGHDAPEPDIVLTTEPDGEGIMPAESVKLVIEVADSTLATDLKIKAALYARFAVPEYWVVDVRNGTVHQLWAPEGDNYAMQRQVALAGILSSATLPDLSVSLG